MTNKFKSYFCLVIGVFFLATFSVCGQKGDEVKEVFVDPYFQEKQVVESFSEEQLKEARRGIDFQKDYETKKEEKKEQEPPISNPAKTAEFAKGLIKTLFIIALIGVIFAVLFYMIGNGSLFKPKSKKITGSVTSSDLEEIEDNLEDSDIEAFLKKALEDQDYKVAIRLYFLMAIRDLSRNNFIKWKRDKTNRDYIRETRDQKFANNFKETAHIYEKAWYGDFDVMYSDFKEIEKKFNTLIDQIKIKAA